MIDYKKDLNAEQYAAVMAGKGPILVIAGAGSGKTHTLTYRVARMIETGIRPERILLATFTNKSAREMMSRVEKLTGVDIGNLWGGTFHHIANMILRREAPLLGLQKNYAILDEEDANQLANACIGELEIDPGIDGFPRGNIVRDVIGLALNTGGGIEAVISRKYPHLIHWTQEIIDLSFKYSGKKRGINALDFDDLLLNWRELLRKYPETLRYYSEKFLHILVDEYQDTNLIQAEIIDLLASNHHCVMAVGDDSQSIYSFRGADSGHILRFPERYPDAQIFKLEINYRSTPEILDLANRSIFNNERQFPKELRAMRKPGVRPVLAPVRNVSQQANFVAQRIIELAGEGVHLNEIAVLYRAHYHSMELQMEMTRRGIPFEVRSGIRFFEQAHIKDVAAYLRIMANPLDELAWKRALGLYRSVGKITTEKIWSFLSSGRDPLEEVKKQGFLKCASKTSRFGLERFVSTLEELARCRDIPSRMISCVLDQGYRDHLQKSYSDCQYREDDLLQLSAYASKFISLADFLSELALLSNMMENTEPRREDPDGEKVILTTIHQAKGLEWSAVFIIWCSEGMFPLARALREEGGLEEERRLFYVATTRAKDTLYYCHPLIDYGRGVGAVVVSPSRFLEELKPSRGSGLDCPYERWLIDEE